MSTAPTPRRRPPPGQAVPAPLLVAASLTGVEAIVAVLQGLVLLPALEGQRLTMGLTSVLFFAVYGAGLGWCAWRLWRRESWARAPVVLAQLIQILVGASFWGNGTSVVAVVLVTVGLLVLAGIFHPDSLAALDTDDTDDSVD